MRNWYTIFKDGNDWNEKTIVGFGAFAVMVLFALVDLLTGYFGKDLVVQEFIYNSFVWIVLGSFGIDGIQKFSGKKETKEEELP
jgi:uncharacterized PurR-regulated membrane protein YhhQ (DUF165 family)